MQFSLLTLFPLLLLSFGRFAKGIECYNFSCWGVDCNAFYLKKHDFIVTCPNDAEGCLHSKGFVDNSRMRNYIDDPMAVPFLRETRTCWAPQPLAYGGGPPKYVGDCYMSTANQWFPPYQRVLVTSEDCICGENLCNDSWQMENLIGITLLLPLLLLRIN